MGGTDDLPFAELAVQRRAGDPQAAAQPFEQYGRRLLGLVRKCFAGRLADKASSSVSCNQYSRRSFAAAVTRRSISTPPEFMVIVGAHCDQVRLHSTTGLRNAATQVVSGQSPEFLGTISPTGATPNEAAQLEETMQQVLEGLRDLDGRILELNLQGRTISEIAAAGGSSRRSAERSL